MEETVRQESDQMHFNRNQFMIVGLVLLLLGLQFRLVDSFVLNEKSTKFLVRRATQPEKTSIWKLPVSLTARSTASVQRKSIQPPRWLAWSFISVGAVMLLHGIALRKPD
jgi:hypothetical protein